MNRNRTVSKRAGEDFEVKYVKRRKKLSLNPLPADALKQIISPLADKVPSSQPVRQGEILPVQSLPAPLAEPHTPEDYAREIRRLYVESQSNFMKIGALLDKAESELSPEDYRKLVNALPFERSARSQLRQAYQAIRDGVVPREMACHGGYTTVYQASKLTSEQRRQAIEEGILRPDTRRKEIIAFQSRFRNPEPADELEVLIRRRDNLINRRARLESEIVSLTNEIAVISEKISLYETIL